MFQFTATLTDAQRKEVEALVKESEARDGASACVQMSHTLNADQEMTSWLLATEDGALAGVASVFAPSLQEAEISVCVRPSARGEGLGTCLLKDMAAYLRDRGYSCLLLVGERGMASGKRFSDKFSTEIQHTELSMTLTRPFQAPAPARVTCRKASLEDFPTVKGICTSAYGEDDRDFDGFLTHCLTLPDRQGYLGFLGEEPVAVCFIGLYGEYASVNTVAVHKDRQGQGIGREFLTGILSELVPTHTTIGLEVDSTNPSAQALYQRLGFKETRAVDYHIVDERAFS